MTLLLKIQDGRQYHDEKYNQLIFTRISSLLARRSVARVFFPVAMRVRQSIGLQEAYYLLTVKYFKINKMLWQGKCIQNKIKFAILDSLNLSVWIEIVVLFRFCFQRRLFSVSRKAFNMTILLIRWAASAMANSRFLYFSSSERQIKLSVFGIF